MKKFKLKARRRLVKPSIDPGATIIDKIYYRIKTAWERTNEYYGTNVQIPSKAKMVSSIKKNSTATTPEEIASQMGIYYKDKFAKALEYITPYKPRTYKQAQAIQRNLLEKLGIHANISDIMMGNLSQEAINVIISGQYYNPFTMMSSAFYGS